jgi:hypothetical protein
MHVPLKSSSLLKQIAAQPSIESLQAYLTSQRAYFTDSLSAAIDALESKIQRRRIGYDMDRFRAHVQAALKAWQRSGGSKARQ